VVSLLLAEQWDLLRWKFVDPCHLRSELSAQAGDEATTLASLRWGPEEALAQCAGAAWRLRHQGLWVQHVLVSPVAAHSQQETDVTRPDVTVTRSWRHHWWWPVGPGPWGQWARRTTAGCAGGASFPRP
jgi:hypothetical protein